LERVRLNRRFKAKELGFLIKVIFKGLIVLMGHSLSHGNLTPFNICFMGEGHTKIGGWYF